MGLIADVKEALGDLLTAATEYDGRFSPDSLTELAPVTYPCVMYHIPEETSRPQNRVDVREVEAEVYYVDATSALVHTGLETIESSLNRQILEDIGRVTLVRHTIIHYSRLRKICVGRSTYRITVNVPV